jgi:hypothetical protein
VGKFKKANLSDCVKVWAILIYAAETKPNTTKQSNKTACVKYL